MRRMFFLGYACMACLLLTTACGEEAAFRRWERDWEKTPRPVYPTAVEGVIPTAAEIGNELELYRELAGRLHAINPSALDENKRQRWTRYTAELKAALESREYLSTDPAAFHIGGTLAPLLEGDSGKAAQRMQRIGECLEKTPAYYETAKQLLKRPEPARTLEAIEKQLQTLRLLRESLPVQLAAASLDEATEQRILEKAYQAKLAVKDYLAFCESLHFEQQRPRHSLFSFIRKPHLADICQLPAPCIACGPHPLETNDVGVLESFQHSSERAGPGNQR
ncbi:MAG: hypothetical protein HUU01_22565, partial [Saprospiraceae bacterium]|nr:hypothetical protein [Saprospiraceae bacterium]